VACHLSCGTAATAALSAAARRRPNGLLATGGSVICHMPCAAAEVGAAAFGPQWYVTWHVAPVGSAPSPPVSAA
jgi:hypothetical protein